MAHNVLYNFIKTYIIPSKIIQFENCEHLESRETTHNKLYFCFHLGFKSFVFNDEKVKYTLKDHHISIYETEEKNNSMLSQYHYTAYFTNEDSQVFQLHVYFDENDTLTQAPVFSMQNDQGEYVPIDARQHRDVLVNLATDQMHLIISELRKKLDDKVRGLESSYKELEKNASNLSKSMEDNSQKYISSLDKMLRALDKLSPLVKHNHYEKIKKFIRCLKVNVEKTSLQIKLKAAKEPEEAVTEEKWEAELSIARNAKSNLTKQSLFSPRRKRKPVELDEQFKDFNKEIDALYEVVCTYSDKDLRDQVEYIVNTYVEINSLSLILESNKQKPSLTALKKLNQIYTEIHCAGEIMFKMLLDQKQFLLAEKMSSFYYLINPHYLNRALQTKDADLLDFIISHGDISINNQVISVKGKTYKSALHFCYYQDHKQKNVIACFAVLLKYDVSLLMSWDNNPPFAYSILSTHTHPLRPVLLLRCSEDLKYRITLHRGLIAALNSYIKNNDIEENQRIAINENIQWYSSQLECLHASPELTPSIVQKTAKEDKALVERLKEVSSEGLFEKIAADEDVVKLLRRVVDEKANYFKRLTPAQRRIEMRAGVDQRQGIKQLLNEIPMQFMDSGFIKAQTMSYYKTVISVYQLKSELVDIRKELKKPAKGKGDLQYKKQLALEERSLMEQITEKQAPFDLSSDRVAELVECNEKLEIFLESETGLQFK